MKMWDGILNGCAWLLTQLANLVGDWGLAIIIVTLIIRLALFPLQRKQFRSTYEMQKFQPKIQEIQQRYEGDQQKIQEETMKLYQETGFNPLAGCLPMFVQMPVFIILFQVLRWKIPVGSSFYSIIPDLRMSAFTADTQNGIPAAMDSGIEFALPYIILCLLFIVLSMSPMIYQYWQNKDNPNSSQSLMMTGVMGIMFIWMAWISPAGVMLYWALSSGFGLAQQFITQRNLKNQDEKIEEELRPVKPVEVTVERRQKKKRPRKSH